MLNTSSSLPESSDEPDRLAVAEAAFSLLGFAPGGVYRASQVTLAAGALLPHRFTLTCAATGEPIVAIGGLLSAALSLTSRSVGVTDNPVLWSPDFPLDTTEAASSDHPTHSLAELRIEEHRQRHKKARRSRIVSEPTRRPLRRVSQLQLSLRLPLSYQPQPSFSRLSSFQRSWPQLL